MVFMVKNNKTEYNHQIQYIRIRLGSKFQLKQTFFKFWVIVAERVFSHTKINSMVYLFTGSLTIINFSGRGPTDTNKILMSQPQTQ